MQEVDESTIIARCVAFTALRLVRLVQMMRAVCTQVKALTVAALVR